jgi:hypothetical protein
MASVSYLYPATAAHAATVRANLAACGVSDVRVRVMPNGAMRLVLRSRDQRESVRDALVLSGAVTASGKSFASPSSSTAWNGDVEIFVRFAA